MAPATQASFKVAHERGRHRMLEWAYAQTSGAAPGGGGGIFGQINMLIPFIAMFAIFYFLLIRPQQKKQRDLRQLLQNLKRGDRVVTSGGIYGTIVKIRNDVIHLEIADQVRIRVNKSSIADLVGEADRVFDEVEVPKKG
jgi:preprotein translocase subunit YajC